MAKVILVLIHLASIGISLAQRKTLQSAKSVTEIYWESYLGSPNTLKSCLSKVNAREVRETARVDETPFALGLGDIPITLKEGKAVVVSIAFAHANLDFCERRFVCRHFVCGLHLFEGVDEQVFEQLKSDIKTLQDKGALVKLAFGGEEYGNTMLDIKTTFLADTLVDIMVSSVARLGVDGLDLVQREGCGGKNLICDDQTSVHLYVLQRLREEMPDKIIGYTFPAGNYELNFPFLDIVRYGDIYLDTITFFGTNSRNVFKQVAENNVNKNKVVFGFPIGCDQEPFRNVTLGDAKKYAEESFEAGIKGISLWSINRDTNRRAEGNGCNKYQTGSEDGTFFRAIYSL